MIHFVIWLMRRWLYFVAYPIILLCKFNEGYRLLERGEMICLRSVKYQAFQIDIRTLRYYDDIDLFKPATVDHLTNYRYYSVDQFEH